MHSDYIEVWMAMGKQIKLSVLNSYSPRGCAVLSSLQAVTDTQRSDITMTTHPPSVTPCFYICAA